jgi:hypothetical protein
MGRRWRIGALVSGLVVALLIAAGLTDGFSSGSGGKATANTTTTTVVHKHHVHHGPKHKVPKANNPVVSQAVINDLTITSVNVSCTNLVDAYGGATKVSNGENLVVFKHHIGALKGVPPRLWSDALDVPYFNTVPQNMLEETLATICENPLYGSTVANMFAHLTVDGVSVLKHNPWLGPFVGSLSGSGINATASTFTPLLDVTHATQAQARAAVSWNLSWQVYAEKLDTMLTNFQVNGIQALPSVLNYHRVVNGLEVGGLPEVELNPNQENLPALILDLTIKGQCAPLARIGFNTGDKRPEVFATPSCAPPAPAPKPVHKSVPKSVTMPNTVPQKTPHPGTTTTTPPKHPTTTVPPHHGTTTTTSVTPTTVSPSPTTTTTCPCHAPTTVPPPPVTVPTLPSAPTTTLPGATSPPGGVTGVTAPTTTDPPGTLPPTTTPGSGVAAH